MREFRKPRIHPEKAMRKNLHESARK